MGLHLFIWPQKEVVVRRWASAGLEYVGISLEVAPTITNPLVDVGSSRPRICLALLAARADPDLADEQGLTPAALASNNEALWPLFSAAGCERVQCHGAILGTCRP